MLGLVSDGKSNLSLDVHFLESGLPGGFEKAHGLAAAKPDLSKLIVLVKKVFTSVVADELSAFLVSTKAKLICDETKADLLLVPGVYVSLGLSEAGGQEMNLRDADFGESDQAFATDKLLNQEATHLRGLKLKLEELIIVSQGKSRAYSQGILDGLVLLLCGG